MNFKSNLKQTFAQLIASFRYTSISSIYPADSIIDSYFQISVSLRLKRLFIKLKVLVDPSGLNFWSNMTMNYDDDDNSSTT